MNIHKSFQNVMAFIKWFSKFKGTENELIMLKVKD